MSRLFSGCLSWTGASVQDSVPPLISREVSPDDDHMKTGGLGGLIHEKA
jgi:hypothetical protein